MEMCHGVPRGPPVTSHVRVFSMKTQCIKSLQIDLMCRFLNVL